MQTIKKAMYRQRVAKLQDGTIQLVFGNDPIDPSWMLLADHDISEVATISDHVDTSQRPTITINEQD